MPEPPGTGEDRLYADVDPYGYELLLTEPERAVLRRLRGVLDHDVAPYVDEWWERAECPPALRDALAAARLLDPVDGREASALLAGFRTFELARTDVSTAVLFGGHGWLFRGAVRHGGSPEQVARWDPVVRDWTTWGAFALTEPDHGSDVARGLETTAVRDGDTWVLAGAKRWIGGAGLADLLAVFARDVTDRPDGPVLAFLVDRRAPGVTVEAIARKTAVRIVESGHVTLDRVRVPEPMRLQRVASFRDVNRLLRPMRTDVAWLAAGAQAGAYRAALAYARRREQFGRPIASFQLVQAKLATMLGNLTASLGMAVRLSQLADDASSGAGFTDADAALAMGWVARRTRETVALAREVCGGNGITLDAGVARFFADAEAIYTFEGTDEITALVVGRAVTGISAFV
ncbi:acyl-CoA dehydrogenase family protein [Isoptericola sp. NPDC019482]|uniref:acyl-CoA dehydrogenase family protein n=1 Tax=Isoptericola sp. NPDC019482 TaxID=3154688 RepID=UPI00347E38FC